MPGSGTSLGSLSYCLISTALLGESGLGGFPEPKSLLERLRWASWWAAPQKSCLCHITTAKRNVNYWSQPTTQWQKDTFLNAWYNLGIQCICWIGEWMNKQMNVDSSPQLFFQKSIGHFTESKLKKWTNSSHFSVLMTQKSPGSSWALSLREEAIKITKPFQGLPYFPFANHRPCFIKVLLKLQTPRSCLLR